MALKQPTKIAKVSNVLKRCALCGNEKQITQFANSRSIISPDGKFEICDTCATDFLKKNDFSWDAADELCRAANLPFIPNEWERIKSSNTPSNAFHKYSEVFLKRDFDNFGWRTYDNEFRRLRSEHNIEEQLPEISEEHERELAKKWGRNYDYDALVYLENLFEGLMATQTINGSLQYDQALKICKISYEIDNCIRGGETFDKLLSSYEKLVKTAEFTPKNAKNLNNFDSVGELVKWLEKRGWHNPYYDNVSKDVVDETIENIQAFNRRLYVNESTIGEEITRRLEALKISQDLENQNTKKQSSYYETDKTYDLDIYESAGYEQLLGEDDFEAELGGGLS